MKKREPLVSIIIRTKNEEVWIESCLRAIQNQIYKNIEIILVDNFSKDNTVDIAKKFKVKVVRIKNYKPGKALNIGIKKSNGHYIVCLSPHCIPKNNNWLNKLIQNLNLKNIGAVYGRQLPMSYSSALDKRDLLTVFGQDRRVQIKDIFFHNANSAFKKSIWEKYNFNSVVTNVEDRLWAKQLIDKKFKIIYEPKAAVYHWHGINQDGDLDRAEKIIGILENEKGFFEFNSDFKIKKPNLLTIIPIKGESLRYKNINLLSKTIESLKSKLFSNDIVVSSDNKKTLKLSLDLGIKTLNRPSQLSENYIDIMNVASFSAKKLLKNFGDKNIVIIAQETYPFRNKNLLDKLLKILIQRDLDAIVTVKKEKRSIINSNSIGQKDFNKFFIPRGINDTNNSIFLSGLLFIAKIEKVINQNWNSNKIMLYPINDDLSSLEIRSEKNLKKIAHIL